MNPLRHHLGLLWGLCCCVLPAWGQVDSQDSIPNYDLRGLSLRIYLDPPYAVKGSREWNMDSLSLANAQMGNLTELFREMPSVAVKRYAPGGLATPTIRGTGAGHVQTFWEGLPVNSPMLGQQDFALGAGSLFDQVALRYGGASLQEGSGGLGGAIRLGNAIARDFHPRYSLKVREQYGSFLSNASNVDLAASNGKWGTNSKLYLNTARNHFPFPNIGLAGTPLQRLQNAAFLQWGGLQELFFSPSRQRFVARLWLLNSARDLPPTMLVQDARESQTDQTLRSMLEWKAPTRKGAIETKAGWFREAMTYRNPLAGIVAPSRLNRWIAQSDYDHMQEVRKLALKGAGIRLLYDQATTEGYADSVAEFLASAYAKGEWHLHGRNFLSLLLREEYAAAQFSPILGYLGGQFDLGVKGLSLHANASRNHRFPTLNDRYWVPGGNPNLRPELSHGGEAAVVYTAAHKRNLFHAELGGYVSQVNDWILWVPVTAAIWQPENVQRVTAMGIEAILRKTGSLGNLDYRMDAHYTFSSSRNQDGHQLIYTPQHNASLRLNLAWTSWSLQCFQDWNSRRYTVMDNSEWIKGFGTTDLSLGWKYEDTRHSPPVHHRLEAIQRRYYFQLQAGLRNLANVHYQTVAWRPMPGRSFFFRVDIVFSGSSRKNGY